jgi:chemotaxis protein MotA
MTYGGLMSAIIGIIGILSGLYYTLTHHASGFNGYFDKSALVLTIVLPPSIMLLSHTLTDFFTGYRILFRSMFGNHAKQQSKVIDSLSNCSARIRSEGIGALAKDKATLEYDLLIDGVSLILNNFTAEEIRHNIEAKIQARQNQVFLASSLFENMAKVSPGVGMLGTLMGLINMMANLNDPASIGSGMALAMIGTLYGLSQGTFFYAPFSEKISIEGEKLHEMDLLVMEGVLALKGKKSSLHMNSIVRTYGSQKHKENLTSKSSGRKAQESA